MSREAVNQIIDRAVADESFFEQLRTDPERAIAGFDLDPAEASAFKSGAYDVVVRATRKDRADQSMWDAKRAATKAAAAARPAAVDDRPPPAKAPVAGLVGFFLGVLVIGGGIGAFRYVESQWPWQALGAGKAASPAAIPAASLGARPKPTAATTTSRPPAAVTSPAPSSAPNPAPKPAASGNGQAQLRPTTVPAPSTEASPSTSSAQQTDVEKAYVQAVGARFANVLKSFFATATDLKSNGDPTKDVGDLSAAVADLRQHVNDAPPPDRLKVQHAALVEAVPLMQSDVDQLKTAVDQKNTIQAALIAGEIGSLLPALPDEVALATQPHPELYQPVDSSQNLTHIVTFEVISRKVTASTNASATVTLSIGVQAGNPTTDQVSDTLRHSVVAARQSYPQAGQVRVVALQEANGSPGAQLGTADWYCSPEARPPDAGTSASWQDSCSKVYLSLPAANGSSSASTVPY